MRNVDCGLRNEECGLWNVECGMWNGEWGVWNVECGIVIHYSLFTTYNLIDDDSKFVQYDRRKVDSICHHGGTLLVSATTISGTD